ncbi:hypothetical protein RGV33_19525 [Pseudomonas sp. Bout1]|uniref:hypothetical protein n=1 Tax=Pseudomonas sp. Bout1 TaxID=3048600 RepID=UPI002AB425E4|nr:hypothetical protein [Pseudomonas sp. Bout1]MDY7533850.1 hypothetical protein [Pseudomonas sp. Bout1]MEB0188898.1 hypothetical protein [Pseudomonas sp. Bout1]
MKLLKILLVMLAGLEAMCVVQASEKRSDPSVVPLMYLYNRQGETSFNCSFALTPGDHKLKKMRGCVNDDAYYFKLENPTDGMMILITDDPDCTRKEPWALYLIIDPVYGSTSPLLRVDAAFNVPNLIEIAPGIYAADADTKGGKQLAGQVSCVWSAS